MSESERDNRKTDNFSSFLDVLSRGVNQTRSAPEATQSVDPKDAVIRALKRLGGQATFSDLLGPSVTSLDPLMAVIQQLQKYGLVEQQGGLVRLTPDGEAAAEKLGPEPTGGPAA
jgi:hypothetical protein